MPTDSGREQPMLLLGVGNDYRGDDAAGLLVARRLQDHAADNLAVVEQSGEGAALLEAWKNAEAVILIDAVQSGAAAGTIHRLDAHARPLPSNFFHYSTHAFSVAEAVELARALQCLPPRLVVYGIEGKNFAAGLGLSIEVEKAVNETVVRIQQELNAAGFLRQSEAKSDA